MKKLLIVLIVLAVLVIGGVVGFKVAPAPKSLGASERFTEAEIAEGAKLAEKHVKGFAGVLRVLRVRYTEAKADEFWATDYERGTKTPENTMTFFVDFATGANTTSLNIWDVYTDYSVTLTRENKDAPFEIADSGY